MFVGTHTPHARTADQDQYLSYLCFLSNTVEVLIENFVSQSLDDWWLFSLENSFLLAVIPLCSGLLFLFCTLFMITDVYIWKMPNLQFIK